MINASVPIYTGETSAGFGSGESIGGVGGVKSWVRATERKSCLGDRDRVWRKTRVGEGKERDLRG